MRLEGILLPSDWNDDGQVTSVILATTDENELQVECSRSLAWYDKFLRQKVIVDGEFAGSGQLIIKAIDICNASLPQKDGDGKTKRSESCR
jgi:hypothetical protein